MLKCAWIALTITGAGVLVSEAASAQTQFLQPGDIAVTCVDTSGVGIVPDQVQITPLVSLPALTDPTYQIQYSDREANAAGTFNTNNENALAVALDGAHAAGVPFLYLASGLVAPDEQVFLFQGALVERSGILSTGTLLWGFQMSTAGGWATVRTDNLSELPTVLASASVALTTNGNTKFAYTGPTTGTRDELQAKIANPDNWTSGVACPGGFTVIGSTDGGTDGDAGDAPDDLSYEKGNDAVEGGPADGADGAGGAGMGGSSGEGGAAGMVGAAGAMAGGSGGSIGAGGAANAAGGAAGTVDERGAGGSGGIAEDGGADAVADTAGTGEIGVDAQIEKGPGPVSGTGGAITPMANLPDGSVGVVRTQPPGGCNCATGPDHRGGGASAGLVCLMMALLAFARRRRSYGHRSGGSQGGRSGRLNE